MLNRFIYCVLGPGNKYMVSKTYPQFYTYAGKWPDLVIEKLLERPGRVRQNVFAANVFIEFKTSVNLDDPIQQLLNDISSEYDDDKYAKGFLIGVKGTKWTIRD